MIQDPVQDLLERTGVVLSLDIGSGTMDAVLALPGQQAENWPKFVLPAPALRVTDIIREQTRLRHSVWLYGSIMGGGFADAVREQCAMGLKPTASLDAAASLHDDMTQVRGMGVTVTEYCPAGYIPVPLADYDKYFWYELLKLASLPIPDLVTAAVQDHGCHADVGNREGRFRLWRELLAASQGVPLEWIFTQAPRHYTRLHALQTATDGPVADTGTAALLGALAIPEVRQRSARQGITVVNVGNSHTIAFLVYREHVHGIYEQHTDLLDTEGLIADLKDFRFGWLPDELVRERGGHGCVFLSPLPPEAEGFMPTFAFGPKRKLLQGYAQFVAPHGDMMLAGCHGLLWGLALSTDKNHM